MGVTPATPAQRYQWPQRDQWDSLGVMAANGISAIGKFEYPSAQRDDSGWPSASKMGLVR